ncbi:hypothetical protein ACFFMP_02395 [Pseudoroseomonas cervicalis]|nr:hypothetical protein [Pseudoroseomonas cervicalis]
MDEDILSAGPLHRQLAVLQGRLAQAFPPARFAHGVVPARLDAKVWADMVGRAPYVGIGFLGIGGTETSARKLQGRCSWRVFLVAKNARPAERFTGDARAPGLFGMIHAAAIFLQGHTPEPPGDRAEAEGTIIVGAIDNAYGADWLDMNGACATLEVSMPLSLSAQYRGEELLRLATSWPSGEDGGATLEDMHELGQDQ